MNKAAEILNKVESKFLDGKTDVTSLIKADHRKVDALFMSFEGASERRERSKLLEQIINELEVHTTAEEKIVYSLLDKQDHEKTNEAFVEHHTVQLLLKELSGMKITDDMLDAKVKVLWELVKHHVREEETEMLPKLKDADQDLKLVGEKFAKEKDNLKKRKTSAKANPAGKSATTATQKRKAS